MSLAAALLAVTLAQGYYSPEEAEALFAQASDAYSKEDYAAAERGFKDLLEHGFGGADVLYNLGTTSLAAGKLGEAVLYLERARRLRSGDDIESNLALAQSRQLDQVVGARANEPFLQRLARATSERLASISFLVSWVLSVALLGYAAFGRRGPRFRLGLAGAGLLVVALFTGSLVGAHAYVTLEGGEAVVLAKELKARELPRDAAKVAFEVHAGLRVRVLERAGRFVRIALPNGLEGWAEKEGVAEL